MTSRPIEDCQLTEVLCRVSYQLAVIHYRRDPKAWSMHPPTSLYALAESLRANGFSNLYWTLNGAARWVAQGFPLRVWRDQAPTATGSRAFHKRKPSRRS